MAARRLLATFATALLLVVLAAPAASARPVHIANAANCDNSGSVDRIRQDGFGKVAEPLKAPKSDPVKKWVQKNPAVAAAAATMGRVTIPVAFHVITRGDSYSEGNIPLSQIQAQIDVLNESYSGAHRRRTDAVPVHARERRPHAQHRVVQHGAEHRA